MVLFANEKYHASFSHFHFHFVHKHFIASFFFDVLLFSWTISFARADCFILLFLPISEDNHGYQSVTLDTS